MIKRRKQKKEFKLNLKIGKKLLSLFLLIILVNYLWKTPYLRISKVTCTINSHECDNSIDAELENYIGEQGLLINKQALESKIKNFNPAYEKVNIFLIWPSKLNVEITSKKSAALVKTDNSIESFYVDAGFKIIGKTTENSDNLPTVIVPKAEAFGIGDNIDDKGLQAALELIQIASERNISVSTVEMVTSNLIIMKLPEGKRALFTSSKSIPRQVSTLQVILSKAKMIENAIEYDLRFSNPVIR